MNIRLKSVVVLLASFLSFTSAFGEYDYFAKSRADVMQGVGVAIIATTLGVRVLRSLIEIIASNENGKDAVDQNAQDNKFVFFFKKLLQYKTYDAAWIMSGLFLIVNAKNIGSIADTLTNGIDAKLNGTFGINS